MPDSNPPTPPVPGPTPDEYDQAQLATVKNGEALARSAQKITFQPTLSAEGMVAATPGLLLAAGERWRDLSRRAVEATNRTRHGTGTGREAETGLRRQVEYYRSKARLYLTQHPALSPADVAAFKKRYYFGEDVFADDALAGQKAADIFRHGGEDGLPAITPARATAAAEALRAFAGDDANPQTDATTLRRQRDAVFAEIMRLRHEIQHAADAGWPWWEDANMGIRREFLLPVGRPFTATD